LKVSKGPELSRSTPVTDLKKLRVMLEFSLERFTVLLVEDNKYVANILVKILRELSIENIILARDGVEFIECLKEYAIVNERSIDLVISDMVMSPING
jgi:CheY-like chemotaxis protein